MRIPPGLAAVLLALALGGCASLPRPTGPEAPAWRDARVLESEPASRLLLEVDRVQGSEPRPRALRKLALRLRDLTDKPDGITVVVDDLLPPEAWQESDQVLRSLARRTRSLERPAPGSLATVHILYGPRFHGYRGFAWTRPVMARTSPNYDAALILIFQDQLKSIAWITDVRQEASVLVHEFGHTLGLVGDPGHGSGGHCTNAWCSMYDGVDARTFFLYFFPTLFTGYLPMRYCADCSDDLYPEDDGVPPGRRRNP
ncbi:MAG: hypothetical protein KDA24_07840 [Deltaproteobacteria bacterium]|nr:hypothetical protein [Deltaproteobacteria bacterium]